MIAMRDASPTLTSRANSARARAASVKKSFGVSRDGARLRATPATPAASTAVEIGDM